jgi:hypothetical protein
MARRMRPTPCERHCGSRSMRGSNTFECLFALLVVGHGRRQLLWFAVSRHSTAEWLAQQIVEAFPWDAVTSDLFAAPLMAATGARPEYRQVARGAMVPVVTPEVSPASGKSSANNPRPLGSVSDSTQRKKASLSSSIAAHTARPKLTDTAIRTSETGHRREAGRVPRWPCGRNEVPWLWFPRG